MSESEIKEIQWTIHTTHPEMVKSAREKLSEVVDPEIGMTIIQLGLVRDIEIENNIARLKMILTTPFCPYGPQLLEATRYRAQEALEVPTTIEVGMEMWDPSMAEGGVLSDWGLF